MSKIETLQDCGEGWLKNYDINSIMDPTIMVKGVGTHEQANCIVDA